MRLRGHSQRCATLVNDNSLPCSSSYSGYHIIKLLSLAYLSLAARSEPKSVGPPAGLLSRLAAFLPQIREANDKLQQQIEEDGADAFDIERVDEENEPYIEMVRIYFSGLGSSFGGRTASYAPSGNLYSRVCAERRYYRKCTAVGYRRQ